MLRKFLGSIENAPNEKHFANFTNEDLISILTNQGH